MTLILILAALGIILVLAELVLPGGVLGIGGGVCLAASVYLTFNNYGIQAGGWAFIGLLVFGFAVLFFWMKHFRNLPMTRRLVLRKEIEDSQRELKRSSLLGKQSITQTIIAPSGLIEIDGEKIDVMSETGRIEKGVEVKIVDIRGPSVIVEEM